MTKKKRSELEQIPGVGPSLSHDLNMLGIFAVADLRGKDPEVMYRKTCAIAGTHVDRCVLYVYRCAVYFASNQDHDPYLLKWWNWKDKK